MLPLLFLPGLVLGKKQKAILIAVCLTVVIFLWRIPEIACNMEIPKIESTKQEFYVTG